MPKEQIKETALLEQCNLRPIIKDDQALILEMRNQEHVRNNMISQKKISEKEHSAWFKNTLNSPNSCFFIFNLDDKPCGVIGVFNIQNKKADWSFYLREKNTPKRAGTFMCALALNIVFEKKEIRFISTKILSQNKTSLNLHKKLGFVNEKTEDLSTFHAMLSRNSWNKAKIQLEGFSTDK